LNTPLGDPTEAWRRRLLAPSAEEGRAEDEHVTGSTLQRIRAHRYAIGGYACVFNTISVLRGVRELVKPGAFTNALAAGGWYLLDSHIVGRASLASMAAGTLHMEDDRYGLWFEAALPDDDDVGARLMAAVCRRAIGGVSTGGLLETSYSVKGTRILTDTTVFEIGEISLVSSPARVGTWVRPNAVAQRDRLRLWRLTA